MPDIDSYNNESNDSFLSRPMKMVDKEMPLTSSMAIINKLHALKQNISGGSSHDKPAELFRKDLISAMKLADSEALRRDDYCLISDHWRQDWEKGVQVPVNPDALKFSKCVCIAENENMYGPYSFKMPKKLLHAVADDSYRQGLHELHETQKLADEMCRYDLDDLDVIWLGNLNCLRLQQGDTPLMEYEMERVMEALETRCYDGLQAAMKNVEGLGIEYDENVLCDICQSPESEDGNEMIFCDACDICVHQACYGVQKIPEGNWLCRPCAVGIKPSCVLCPNTGGAMKSTHDGSQWAHLSCSLWIPEIAIVDTEKMEPIDKISEIPANRWALICSLCRERNGACIQCSVKKCKIAFHVTCAFQEGLEMKANFDEETELILKGYCRKHSKKRDAVDGSPKKTPTSTPKKQSEMSEEEKKANKTHKLELLAEEFYTYVGDLSDLAEVMQLDHETVDILYSYWLIKRRVNRNKALMTPKVEEGDVLLKQREDGLIARLKMFVHLRQDLERVRNLCYMVSRREKLRNQLTDIKQSIFMQQVAILRSHAGRCLNARDLKSVITAHLEMPSVYDRPDDVLRSSQTKLCDSMSTCNELSASQLAAITSSLPKVSRVKGHRRPIHSIASSPVEIKAPVAKPKTSTPASSENPYARPKYKSFSWLLSSRRRSSGINANTSTPSSNTVTKPSHQVQTPDVAAKTTVTRTEGLLDSTTCGAPDQNVSTTGIDAGTCISSPVVIRRRGRKRKISALNETVDVTGLDLSDCKPVEQLMQASSSVNNSTVETSLTSPKRRGRKPKIRAPSEAVDVTGLELSDCKPVEQLMQASSSVNNSTVETSLTSPKRRGRKPKIRAPSEAVDVTGLELSDCKPVEQLMQALSSVNNSTVETSLTSPKRRGRKPKIRAPSEAVDVTGLELSDCKPAEWLAHASSSVKNGTVETTSNEPKRRGRKRKISALNETVDVTGLELSDCKPAEWLAHASSSVKNGTVETTSNEPKRRGRKRRRLSFVQTKSQPDTFLHQNDSSQSFLDVVNDEKPVGLSQLDVTDLPSHSLLTDPVVSDVNQNLHAAAGLKSEQPAFGGIANHSPKSLLADVGSYCPDKEKEHYKSNHWSSVEKPLNGYCSPTDRKVGLNGASENLQRNGIHSDVAKSPAVRHFSDILVNLSPSFNRKSIGQPFSADHKVDVDTIESVALPTGSPTNHHANHVDKNLTNGVVRSKLTELLRNNVKNRNRSNGPVKSCENGVDRLHQKTLDNFVSRQRISADKSVANDHSNKVPQMRSPTTHRLSMRSRKQLDLTTVTDQKPNGCIDNSLPDIVTDKSVNCSSLNDSSVNGGDTSRRRSSLRSSFAAINSR